MKRMSELMTKQSGVAACPADKIRSDSVCHMKALDTLKPAGAGVRLRANIQIMEDLSHT